MSASFSSLPPHAPYGNPSPHNPVSRSFGPTNGHRSQSSLSGGAGPPQIYTAVYSGVAVYEMEVHNVAIMRRRSDSWLNATQILKVAGIDKGKRTKILEKEILTGEHEKVQGGYGRYQGTWISYVRGRQFCRQYDVEDILRPLLDYDIKSDGTGNASKADTPTKEQAMAANRKRFFNPNNMGDRINGSLSNGTFFQNISPTASTALAAMNKAARFETPSVRPPSAQRRPSNMTKHSSQSHGESQDSKLHSYVDGLGDVDSQAQPMYGPVDSQNPSDFRMMEAQEPPRKRLRPSSSQDTHPLDPALRDDTTTEPNESFMQFDSLAESEGGPVSLPPLHPLTDKVTEQKRLTLLALFEEPSREGTDTERALHQLSGQDLDIPLDSSANTALHWAATLARVPLMKSLIKRGANIMIGNAASQTPLMAAVQVNNSLDHSCFLDMLEILGPLIDVRDSTGRTVLHHIAVSSGIKGRAQSSRYYLESLLAFTVRQGSNPNSQQSSFNANTNTKKTMNLGRFMSEVVNVQDKSGNTALNLVSRIGNRPIINQLEEVGADFEIPNNTGFRPADFGVFPRSQTNTQQSVNEATTVPASQEPTSSQVDQIKEEIFATTNSILAQTQSQYATELAVKQSQLDAQNAALREITTMHAVELEKFERLQRRAKERVALQQKASNLRRAMAEQGRRAKERGSLDADGEGSKASPIPDLNFSGLPPAPSSRQREDFGSDDDANMDDPNGDMSLDTPETEAELSSSTKALLSKFPSAADLRARLSALDSSNADLAACVTTLRGRSSEIETQYRKVVSMCTGVEEGNVEAVLEGLVVAVESEGMDVDGSGAIGVGTGRVREFLRKVGDFAGEF